MKAAVAIAFGALLLGVLLGGAAPFGRVLLAIGAPGLAAPFFADPAWRGVAAYRDGDHDAAARAFEAAGSMYNLGNALVRAGRYAAALEAYDLAVARDGDAAARANFDVVTAYYAGLGIDAETISLFGERKIGASEESFVARGNARAAGSGSEVTNTNTMLGLAQLESHGEQSVRQIFDDKFIVADERWLTQLDDVPGAFMAARIAQEHKRRRDLGLAPPAPEDPR
ncbi:hypothetical protein AB1M95_03705 [Sulfitobacter sp. LCG007]